MTNTMKVKRSAVPGKIPTTVQLTAGELAVNTNDERAFFSSGTNIRELLTELHKGTASGIATLDASGKVPDSQLDVALNDLTDVTLTTPATGQVLAFNGTQWVNGATGSVTVKASALVLYVKNDTGVALTKGTPVFQSGVAGVGNAILVQPADAADAAKMPAVGVLFQDLAPGGQGDALILGEITGVNTSAFNESDLIYVAPGGGYTNVPPTGTSVQQQLLGFVTKIHASNGGGVVTGTGAAENFKYEAGSFYGWNGTQWNVITAGSTQTVTLSGDISGSGQTGTTIPTTLANTGVAAGTYNNTAVSNTPLTFDAKGRLTAKGTEVTITPAIASLQQSGATTGQVVTWNGSQWVPSTPAGSTITNLDSLTDVTVSTPVAGQALIYNGSQWVNFGATGTNGGGAAKRIWSNNVVPMTGTTLFTPAVAAPLATNGTQLWTITFTPFSTAARYVIQTSIACSGTTNNSFITLACFRGTTYIGGTMQIVQSSNNSATLSFSLTDTPNTLSPVTYQARIGITTGSWYVNRRSAEITYGGLNTGWVIWEL